MHFFDDNSYITVKNAQLLRYHLISFDKSFYLCNPNLCQLQNKKFYYLLVLSCCFPVISTHTPSQVITVLMFSHCRLVLPVLEPHINGIISVNSPFCVNFICVVTCISSLLC